MKPWLKSAAAILFAAFSAAAIAQTNQTTDNLVYTTVNPAPTGTNIGSSWTGFTNVTSTGGNTTGDNGSVTGYNPSTGTFMFGYNQGTIAYTYAINQALANAGTGIQVKGYNYSWEINNLNYDNKQSGTDILYARITTFAANNSTILQQDFWSYNTKFDWTTFSGTVNYNNPSLVSEYGNMQITFSGKDSGFWAGYYGPMVRNINVSLNYGVDPCVTNPQSSPTCNGYRTYYTGVMTDDGYAQINLPFAFPFYGQTYTTSYMYTNGVIGFLNPNWGGYCCDGTDLNQQRFQSNSPWNYAIYALNTDLDVGPNSQFYTETTQRGSGLRYHWDRVNEIGTTNENTFSVELRNTGYIGINYQQVNLDPGRSPLIGIAGDISQGQYSQYYFGPAYNLPNLAGTTLQYSGTETTDICAANPLYNPSCPGYQQAYFNQQCSFNALYDTTCPGYAAAFLTYQCNISQLYSPSCPGYQQAYLTQQCGINPLFSSSCQGYQAALDQCSINPLGNIRCPGYQTAVNECSTNGLLYTYCPTYQTELNYCSTDPLFNNLCPGYTAASNACSANPLTYTYCPSYTTAIAACATNPQGNTMCPGYSSTASSSGSTTVVAMASSDPVASAAPLVSDPVVNQSITATATSASPAQTATAAVPLVPAPSTTAAAVAEATNEEKKEDTKAADSSSTSSSEQKKDQPKTMRQQIQEQRVAAARAKAVEEGKELANKMGEAASMEAQIQVQGVVLAAMGFVPGFDNYNKAILPDAVGYRPFEIYRGQQNIDNPAGRRFLTGADRLHQEMVDSQYRLTRSE